MSSSFLIFSYNDPSLIVLSESDRSNLIAMSCCLSPCFLLLFIYTIKKKRSQNLHESNSFFASFSCKYTFGRVSEHSNTRAKTLRHATEMGVEEAVCKQGETGCPFLIAHSDIPSIVPWTEPVRQLYQFIFVLQDFPDRCLLSTGSTGI